MWSNRWSTMPVPQSLAEFAKLPKPDQRAWLDTMPGSDVPVIRQPFETGDVVPFWVGGGAHLGEHHLYDLDVDPDEGENRTGEATEREMIDLLRTALDALEAPDDQPARLGLG